MTKLLLWIMAAVLTLISFVLVRQGVTELHSAYESSKWLVTEGQVLSAEFGIVAIRMNSRTTQETEYLVTRVTYSYKVDGVSYTSTRISFNDDGSSFKATNLTRQELLEKFGSRKFDARRAVIDRYPPGTKVQVFYNPAEPGQAILEKAFPYRPLFMVVFGAIWFLLAFFFIFRARWKKSDKDKDSTL